MNKALIFIVVIGVVILIATFSHNFGPDTLPVVRGHVAAPVTSAAERETKGLVLLGAFFVFFALAVLAFGSWPGRVARRRRHRNAEAINVCAWIGVLTFGVFWLIAAIWAHTNDCEPSPSRRTRTYSKSNSAAAAALEHLGE